MVAEPNRFDRLRVRRASFMLVMLVIVSSLPYLANYLPYHQGHDVEFHLARIESIAQGLAQGQLPVRLYPCQAFGFGYPTGICYPDLFLYAPALLRLAGMPLQWAFMAFAIAVNMATSIISYACFRRVFSSETAGLACTTLWMLAPYRLVDIYLRASVGEYLALMFLPLIVYGVWAAFLDGGREHPLAWLALGCGMAGVVLSHVLSIVLFALPGTALVVVAMALGMRTRRISAMLASLGAAVCACLGLCAFFVVPFLDYYLNEPMQVTGGVNDVARHALQPFQLIGAFWPLEGESIPWWEGTAGEMPSPLGCSLTLVLLLALYLVVVRRDVWASYSSTSRALLVTSLSVAGVLLLLCTWIFPWGLAQEGGVLGSIVGRLGAIQFPWRLVGSLSFLAVLVAGMLLAPLHPDEIFPLTEQVTTPASRSGDHAASDARGRAMRIFRPHESVPSSQLRTVLALVLSLSVVEALAACTSFSNTADAFPQETIDEIAAGDAWGIGNGEYLPRQATWERVEEGKALPDVDRGVVVEAWSHEVATRALLTVSNGSSIDAGVTVPLLWSGMWQVDSMDESSPDAVRLVQDEGFVRVELAPAFAGTVTLSFVEPRPWVVANWVSLLAVCVCCGMAMRMRSRRAGRHP